MRNFLTICLLNLLLFGAIYHRSLIEYFELKYHTQLPQNLKFLEQFERFLPQNLVQNPISELKNSKFTLLLAPKIREGFAEEFIAEQPENLAEQTTTKAGNTEESAEHEAAAGHPTAHETSAIYADISEANLPHNLAQNTPPPEELAAPLPGEIDENIPENLTEQNPQIPLSDERLSIDRRGGIVLLGDSLMQGIGQRLCAKLLARGVPCVNLAKQSSGLLKTRFYNAKSLIAQQLKKRPKAKFIALFGANDLYDASFRGQRLAFGTDEWLQFYARRLANLPRLDAFIALPPMRADKREQEALWFNDSIEPILRARGVKFLRLLGGKFAYYRKQGGKMTRIRVHDGVHFTQAGYELLASRLFALLRF